MTDEQYDIENAQRPDDNPPHSPSDIKRYASYKYNDLTDVVWFPPLDEDREATPEDGQAAQEHADAHPGRLYGSDLIFGGLDQWKRTYGAEIKPDTTE